MTAQPGDLGKPNIGDAPDALEFIDWTGANGVDVIQMVKSYVLRMPDPEVGYCLSCKKNYETEKGELTQEPSLRPAADTFPDHGSSAIPKKEVKKQN